MPTRLRNIVGNMIGFEKREKIGRLNVSVISAELKPRLYIFRLLLCSVFFHHKLDQFSMCPSKAALDMIIFLKSAHSLEKNAVLNGEILVTVHS